MIEDVPVQPYEMILDRREFRLRELADIAVERSIRGEDISRELPIVELGHSSILFLTVAPDRSGGVGKLATLIRRVNWV